MLIDKGCFRRAQGNNKILSFWLWAEILIYSEIMIMSWLYYFIREQYNLLPWIFLNISKLCLIIRCCKFSGSPNVWYQIHVCDSPTSPPRTSTVTHSVRFQSVTTHSVTELKKLQDYLLASTFTQTYHKQWDSHGKE